MANQPFAWVVVGAAHHLLPYVKQQARASVSHNGIGWLAFIIDQKAPPPKRGGAYPIRMLGKVFPTAPAAMTAVEADLGG